MTALKNKTFRASDEIFKALKKKADELQISESDVVNNALRCYLGITLEPDCVNQSEINKLTELVQKLIKANNLKTEV